jgi:hypothetical protein
MEIYSRHRPIQSISAGTTLRILDPGEFEVVWTCDGWHSKQISSGRAVGYAGFSADITPPTGCIELEWTFHWPKSDSWLGYNVKVAINVP